MGHDATEYIHFNLFKTSKLEKNDKNGNARAGEALHAGEERVRAAAENRGRQGQEPICSEVFLLSTSTLGDGQVQVILTGPMNPRRPVLVKGRSDTGTPSAVTGTVCQKGKEGIRQQTTQ